MKRAIAALSITVAACSGPRSIELQASDLPENVAFLGVLSLAPDAITIASATGLRAREAGGASYLYLDLEEPPDVWEVVGFSDEQIEQLSSRIDPGAMWTARLRQATPNEPIFPEPIYARRFDKDGNNFDQAQTRALTADWIRPCPLLVEPDGLPPTDASCGSAACLGVLSQEECRLSFRVGCGFSAIEGNIGPRGQITFERSSELGNCARVAALEGEELSVVCDRSPAKPCELHVYEPAPAEPQFAVEEVALEQVPPPRPDALFRPPFGYIQGFAALEDRLIAATSGDRVAFWFFCDRNLPSRFHIIDPEAMTATSTRAPPCVSGLIKDPLGPGFLAIYGGTERRIGRFDLQGNLQSENTITDNEGKLGPRHHAATIYSDGTNVFVAYSFEDQSIVVPSYLVSIDPGNLTFQRISPLIEQPTPVVGSAGPGRLAVADSNVDVTHVFDASTLELIEDRRTRDECSTGSGVAPSFYVFDAATQNILIGAADNAGATLYFMPAGTPREGVCQGANVVERETQAMGAIQWPRDPTKWLIGASSGGGVHTRVALADPVGRRVLPGSVEIGTSPAVWPQVIGERVFFALPWTAKVVRIEPAR